jgi:tripartite-type tricarboxylate transporter receptor subunit TctC
MSDYLPGYEASTWVGIGAPRNTPAEIVDTLNKEIHTALADPTVKAHIVALGGGIFATTPAEFGKFIADETAKWGNVVRAANVKVQ